MDCETVRGQLAEYADGSLLARDRQAIEAHLANCAACRAELALLAEIEEAMTTWPVVAEPEGMAARVMEAILASEPGLAEKPGLTQKSGWATGAREAAASAGAFLRVHLRLRWQDVVLGLALALTVAILVVSVRSTFLLERSTHALARLTRTVGTVERTALDLQVQRSLSTVERAWYAARADLGRRQTDFVRAFGWTASAIALAAAAATAIVLAVQCPRGRMPFLRHGRRS